MGLSREQVFKYLAADAKTIQLATLHDGKPWICTVWFVYDNELNLYWLSLPDRRHSLDIALSPDVAAAIAIKTDDPTVGIQMKGRAEVVSDNSIVEETMDRYYQKYGQGDKFYKNFIDGKNQHQLYKLCPNEITIFDESKYNGRAERLEIN